MNDNPLNRPIPSGGNAEGDDSPEALKLRIRELESMFRLENEWRDGELKLAQRELKFKLELAQKQHELDLMAAHRANADASVQSVQNEIVRQNEMLMTDLRSAFTSRYSVSRTINLYQVVIFLLCLILAAIAGAGGYWLVLRNETSAAAMLAVNQTATSAALALVYTPTASSDIGIGVQTTVPEVVSALSTGEAVLTQSAIIADAQATSILRGTELAHVQTTLDFQSTQIAAAFSPTPAVFEAPVETEENSQTQAAGQANTLNPWLIVALVIAVSLSALIFFLQRSQRQQPNTPPPGNSWVAILTILAPVISAIAVALIGIIPPTIPLLQNPTATATLANLQIVETREAEGTIAARLATLDSQVQQLTQTAQANSASTSEAISLAISETAEIEVAPEATDVVATDTVSPETTSVP